MTPIKKKVNKKSAKKKAVKKTAKKPAKRLLKKKISKKKSIKKKVPKKEKLASGVTSVEFAKKINTRPWAGKTALLLVLFAAFVWQNLRTINIKVAQRIQLVNSGEIKHQGNKEGDVSGLVGLEAGPGVTVYALSSWEGKHRLQVFDADYKLSKVHVFEAEEIPPGQVRGFAVGSEGELWIGLGGGKILRTNAAFEMIEPVLSGVGQLEALELSLDKKVFVMDRASGSIKVLLLDGSYFGVIDSQLGDPRRMTVTGQGRLVVLGEVSQGYQLAVFDKNLKFERRLAVHDLAPSPPVYLAAGHDELVAINDSKGARGFIFFDVARGRFVGESIGFGTVVMEHPGYVGGDPRSQYFYAHYGAGLRRVTLPLSSLLRKK